MARVRTEYRCSACGARSAKWAGRCTRCDEWNTIEAQTPGTDGGAPRSKRQLEPTPLDEVDLSLTAVDHMAVCASVAYVQVPEPPLPRLLLLVLLTLLLPRNLPCCSECFRPSVFLLLRLLLLLFLILLLLLLVTASN